MRGGRGVYTGMPSDLFEDEEEDDDWWDKWDCFLPYPVDVECTPVVLNERLRWM